MSGNPRELLECTGCQETLPEIQFLLAPTDSLPRNRLPYCPAMTSKRPNNTGSRSYSATADRAEAPARAFELTHGNQRTVLRGDGRATGKVRLHPARLVIVRS